MHTTAWGRLRAPLLALALVATSLLTATSGASSAAAHDETMAARARAALAELRGDGAPQDFHGARGHRELSPALLELSRTRSALDGDERREADEWFRRPTDPDGDPNIRYEVPEEPPVDGGTFRVHYVASGEDASTPEYVQQVVATFQEVYSREITELGWRPPAPDDGRGGNDLMDVYLVDLFPHNAYGFAAAETEGGCTQPACGGVPGYMVMDNDYAGYDPDPLGALQATAAHEFVHVLQFAYSFSTERWAYESTATWFESVVYPQVDARTFYIPSYVDAPHVSLTEFDGSRPYGSYVWQLWLESQYGTDIVRQAWEALATTDAYALGGYAAALEAAGSSLATEFAEFAAATAGWEHGGFPDEPTGQPYPETARFGTLAGDEVGTVELDHMSYALFDLDVPAGSVSATAEGGQGVAGSLVLVASGPSGVQTSAVADLSSGSATATVDATDAERVTAVVVNADHTLTAPKDPFDVSDPSYAADDIAYSVSIGGDGTTPPPPPPPPPGPPPPPPPPGDGPLTALEDGGRLDGGGAADPIAQAIATSQALFDDGAAQRVVLATADRFPDALAGTALAGTRGPILLTSGLENLDPRVAAEISRVTGGRAPVLTLGGIAAVSDEAAAQARAAGGDEPCTTPLPLSCRFPGSGREHTARLIADTVWQENPQAPSLAFVARGDVFADAITGGALAARMGSPVLLTPPNMANPETVDFLATNEVADVIILGGTAAVDDATAAQMPATNQRGRLAGAERTETSAVISSGWTANGFGTGGVVLVNVRSDNGWQTALTAAVASAIFDAPQLGVEDPPAGISAPVAGAIAQIGGPVHAFGDLSLVSEAQLQEAQTAGG